MNGFYIEKSSGSAPQRAKPANTTTASQPVVQPASAPVTEPQPVLTQPQPAPMAPAPPPASPAPSDASQFIEPPSR